MKVIFVGDSETAQFFELLGIEARILENEESFAEELKRIKKTRDCGILIVTENVVSFTKDLVDSLRFSKETPLIVDVPSIKGKTQGRLSLSDYIREAIGIKI